MMMCRPPAPSMLMLGSVPVMHGVARTSHAWGCPYQQRALETAWGCALATGVRPDAHMDNIRISNSRLELQTQTRYSAPYVQS